jgi:hypothetical protein
MHRIVMRWAGRAALAGALLGLGLAGPGLAAATAQAATAQAATAHPATARGTTASPSAHSSFKLPPGVKRACPPSKTPGVASCDTLLVSAADKPRFGVQGKVRAGGQAGTSASSTLSGYTPAQLQSAYGLQSESEGTRQTVAVVVPYQDPTALPDLNTYRSQYGLPPCTTADGCFTQTGAAISAPPTDADGWVTEAQTGMDMVSAVCPNCHIMLVQAAAPDIYDVGIAVQTAVTDGADVVDVLPTFTEFSTETSDDTYFDQPGVAIVAPSGDNGYDNGSDDALSYPAASPYVTAVGGTVLTPDSSVARGWTETVWSGTGSGCSLYEPQPSWQASLDTGCTMRMDNDVSAIAASATSATSAVSDTPVEIYDTYNAAGWTPVGGTEVSASVIAGVYALAGTPAAGSNPASYPYSNPQRLNAVTSGSNGTCSVTLWCTGGTGYNGPAGEGTPGEVLPFTSTGTLTGAIYNGGTSGQCMDNAGNSTTDGNKVQIYTCNGDAAQTWTVDSDGEFQSGNGMCVGVDGGSTAPAESKVWVWNCNSGGVHWLPDSGSGNPQQITPGTLNMCLGVNSAGDGANGTQLWIDTCNTDASQKWTLPYPVPTSTGALQPQVSSAVCIGMNTSSSTKAATLFGCDGDGNQTWTVEANGTIQSGSGYCLDVHDSGTSDGTEVDYTGCNYMASQQWRVQADGSLLNPESGLCLEPSGGADTSGTPLVLEACSYNYTNLTTPTIQEWALPALSS